MVRISTTILFFCLLLFACAQAVKPKPTCANPVGTWANQTVSGSKLIIEQYNSATGQITGKYSSPSGGGPVEYPLVGWMNSAPPRAGYDNATTITFTVRFGQIGSITSWTGICKGDTIMAMWNLTRPNSQFDWDHIVTGKDVFLPE